MRIFGSNKWPKIEIDEIRKRAHLLVVDDSEFEYLTLFRKDGYTIDKWNDIKDLTKLEQGYYDIILLDIMGVGREQSAEQGFGILRHLKNKNPTQIIVVYSSTDWSLKYQEYFKLADIVLAKSADYVDFKRSIDDLLENRFSLGFYINKIVNIAGEHIPEQSRVKEEAKKAILRGSTEKFQSFLEKNTDNIELIKLLVEVANIAISLATSIQ